MFYHKYSLTELDSLYPWEKQIYIDMIIDEINKQNEKNDN